MGRKKRPVYDIVASDSRTPRDGRFLEKVGQYNPLMENATVTILKRDRVLYWLQTGAQPTDTVRSLLSKEGVLLEMHMLRKGREQEEIASAVEKHNADRQSKISAAPAKKQAPAPAPAAEAAPQTATVAHDFSATEQAEARGINEPPTSIMEPAPAIEAPAATEEAAPAEAPAATDEAAPAADAPTEG